MSSNVKGLAGMLGALAQQLWCNTDEVRLEHDSRVLASAVIHSLQWSSPKEIAEWLEHGIRVSFESEPRESSVDHQEHLAEEMDEVRRLRKVGRRKKYRSSVVAPFRSELLELRAKGYSWGELAGWLRRYRRFVVDRSTVMRQVKKWEAENETGKGWRPGRSDYE